MANDERSTREAKIGSGFCHGSYGVNLLRDGDAMSFLMATRWRTCMHDATAADRVGEHWVPNVSMAITQLIWSITALTTAMRTGVCGENIMRIIATKTLHSRREKEMCCIVKQHWRSISEGKHHKQTEDFEGIKWILLGISHHMHSTKLFQSLS